MKDNFFDWNKYISSKNIKHNLIGKKVLLISMNGEPQMKPFTYGIIQFIDDANQIHVKWENGGTLALIPDKDNFKIEL